MICYFQLPFWVQPYWAFSGRRLKDGPHKRQQAPGSPSPRQPEKEKPLLWCLACQVTVWRNTQETEAALLWGQCLLGQVGPFFHWRELWAFCPPLEPPSPHGQFLFTPVRVDSKENWPGHWRWWHLGLAAHSWQLQAELTWPKFRAHGPVRAVKAHP